MAITCVWILLLALRLRLTQVVAWKIVYSLYCLVVFHCIKIHFAYIMYLFSFWYTFGFFSTFGCYEESSYEHTCIGHRCLFPLEGRHMFNFNGYCQIVFWCVGGLHTLSCIPLLQHHGLEPARLLFPWDSPDKNTGMGCHLLLQGIFPTLHSHQ